MTIGKILTSVGIGIVIGLLIAPQKGAKTRKKLSRVYNGVSGSIQTVVDKASGLVDRLRQGKDGSAVSSTITSAGRESWQPNDF